MNVILKSVPRYIYRITMKDTVRESVGVSREAPTVFPSVFLGIMSLSDDLIDWGIETIFSERFWLGVSLIVLMGVQFSVFFTMIRCFFVQ